MMSPYFLGWLIMVGSVYGVGFLTLLPVALKGRNTEPLIVALGFFTVIAFFSVIVVMALSEGGTTVTITEGH